MYRATEILVEFLLLLLANEDIQNRKILSPSVLLNWHDKKAGTKSKNLNFFSVILHPIFHSCPKRVLIGKKFLCKCVDRIVNYSYKKTIFHWNWKEIFRNLLHMEIHHKNNSVQICFQYLKKSGKELWNSFFLKSDSLIC